MLHEQRLQLKVFIVVQYKNCYLVGKINPWWEVNKTLVGGVCSGGIFPAGGKEQVFG